MVYVILNQAQLTQLEYVILRQSVSAGVRDLRQAVSADIRDFGIGRVSCYT